MKFFAGTFFNAAGFGRYSIDEVEVAVVVVFDVVVVVVLGDEVLTGFVVDPFSAGNAVTAAQINSNRLKPRCIFKGFILTTTCKEKKYP